MEINEGQTIYPIQFKDKIDEYLWKEHQILGGCCSSIENLKYSIAREVAEKLTDTFIKKACKWLKENKDHPFIGCEDPCLSGYLTDEFIEAFKKAMEE